MYDPTITHEEHRRLQNGPQRAFNATQNGVNSAPLDSTYDDDTNNDGKQLSEAEDQDDVDGSTPCGSVQGTFKSDTQSQSRSATSGPSKSVLAATTAALAAELARTPITPEAVEAEVQASSPSSKSSKTDLANSGPDMGKIMDVLSTFVKFMEVDLAARQEKLALKREQLEATKNDQATRNTIELQKIALETRRLEMEHQRLLEKQRQDAEYRLAKLKINGEYGLAELKLNSSAEQKRNAEWRNRGRNSGDHLWF